MSAVGPDAPTLCGAWTTRDLAAHLVLRERRPDAASGILLAPLAGYAERVQREIAARPWSALLDDVRSGPPLWSPLRPFDAVANLGEMFVHHEDVRRARPGWEPRQLPPELQDALWGWTRRIGRHGYRNSPVTVVLERGDGTRRTVRSAGTRAVTLRGEPSELLLHAFGRDEVRIAFSGAQADVDTVKSLDRSM